MRKFIVSDLHGNGEVYNSIMHYLDNINLVEDVSLYINGDLIDRGINSFEMLADTKRRIQEKDSFPINYLAGNHELMMYEALKKGSFSLVDLWMFNGGLITSGGLDFVSSEEFDSIIDFVGDLKIYQPFEETVADKPIMLVHAASSGYSPDIMNLRLKDKDMSYMVEYAVWTREKDEFGLTHIIGNDDYFSVIGHTPTFNKEGFIYNKDDKYLNIDGNCSSYALGSFIYDRVPLLEIKEKGVEILQFNHNNEIVGGYFLDKELEPLTDNDLSKRRVYLDHSLDNCEEKQKQLIKEYRA
ncbi:MAG: metallophosphoesterase [Bacilli bacterium]|nr:metallophosphoesterase [Bacilli bacterium]